MNFTSRSRFRRLSVLATFLACICFVVALPIALEPSGTLLGFNDAEATYGKGKHGKGKHGRRGGRKGGHKGKGGGHNDNDDGGEGDNDDGGGDNDDGGGDNDDGGGGDNDDGGGGDPGGDDSGNENDGDTGGGAGVGSGDNFGRGADFSTGSGSTAVGVNDNLPKIGGPRDLHNMLVVYFDWDSDALDVNADAVLAEAEALAVKLGDPQILVIGNADRSGPASYNVGLAERRAKAVSEALAARGLASEVIDRKGFGESRPVVKTGDGVRKRLNRRVEIVFVTTRISKVE